MSQYFPHSVLYSDNDPPFTAEELEWFLQRQCIDHITSSPHFHWSNGFIEQQVKMLKTAVSAAKDARTSLKMLLLELQLTPITPSMSAPWEIMYNCTIQWPDKPLTAVNMEMVRDYLIARKITQKKYFKKSYSVRPLSTLDPSQDVLFCSLASQQSYIPSTIIKTASTQEAIGLMPRANGITCQESTSVHYSKTSSQSTPSHRRLQRKSHNQAVQPTDHSSGWRSHQQTISDAEPLQNWQRREESPMAALRKNETKMKIKQKLNIRLFHSNKTLCFQLKTPCI